jgi:predicted TIM-barrel fold metal-dependent hydrolase
MPSSELIVDVHHHYMPAALFDRLAAQAGGRRIVTNEISLTLNPSRKDMEAHLKVMDEAGVKTAVLTDQVQVMGAEVARMLNDGIAEVERRHPDRFLGAISIAASSGRSRRRRQSCA